MADEPKSLEELIRQLPPDLRAEVYDFARFLLDRKVKVGARQKHLRQDWAGGLREFRDQYTSVELQAKAIEWRENDLA